MKARIDGIKHTGGGTNVAKALKKAFSNLFHSKGNSEVRQIVFLLSDGKTDKDVAEERYGKYRCMNGAL